MSEQDSNRSGGIWLLVLFGLILMIIGLPLLYGGVQLIGLGGSWYYALAGVGIIISGFLFVLRRQAGFWLYILIFLATIAWALWEAGLSFWPLVPRLVAPAVLAVIALLLAPLFPSSSGGKRGPFAVAGLLVLALIATGAYAFQPHGVIRNTVATAATPAPAAATSNADWRHHGRTPAGTRYAPIDQITKDNVKDLKVAWTFRTGDVPTKGAEDQNTPLQVGDTVYTCSSHNIVNALNAETGEPRWKFDPKASAPLWQRCRGVSYYEPAAATATPAADGTTTTTAAPAAAACAAASLSPPSMPG